MIKNKLRILRIISSLNPKYGGPSIATIESTLDLIERGISVDILTHDQPNEIFFKSNKFKIFNLGPALTNYRLNLKFFLWLLKNRKNYDYFIIEGIWEFNTLAARFLLKGKYFVILHGQLDPYFATNFLKKVKKKIYWNLFEYQNLINAKKVLLTSIGEKLNLKNTFVKTDKFKKHLFNFGINLKKINKKNSINNFKLRFAQLKYKKFYLFLGRFHQKKGCEIIINSYQKLGNKISTPVLFIGSYNSDRYAIYLKKLVKKNKLENKIFFSGPLYNDMKWGAICSAKAMLLSSHGESFGVSIVESLSMGTPVITTNKVNIFKYIVEHNAGYISSDNTISFSKKLKLFEKLKKKQLKNLSINAKNCFEKNFNLSNAKKNLASLLND